MTPFRPLGKGHGRSDAGRTGFLSVIDPQAFEIAFTAVTPAALDASTEDEEPVPVCRACGARAALQTGVVTDRARV